MKEFVIEPEYEDRRLDKWMLREMPKLNMGAVQKYLRLKRVRVNGKPGKAEQHLSAGDVLNVYLSDELFEKPKAEDPFLRDFHVRLSIVYEDENILLVDKQPGLMAHPDQTERVNTLLTHVQAYLYQKGEWDSKAAGSFAPALCNRIDRFTGGIVIIAKNAEALRIMNRKIMDREVKKFYLCIVSGTPKPSEGVLKNYLLKTPSGKKMDVFDEPVLGGQFAQTGYRLLAKKDGLSLLECELFTGRTHQIRAQFAHAGHPLLGDNQYGSASFNKKWERYHQALYSYKLHFDFTTEAGVLEKLNGKTFTVRRAAFLKDFFPEYQLKE